MTPYFWDKIWDLVVNLLSVILGGGAIVAYIEWRRYQREQEAIKKEEERLAIDVINAEIMFDTWRLHEKMDPETQLRIYKYQLEGTVRGYTILLEFVLRNTTATELVIIELRTEEPGVQRRPHELRKHDIYDVFDLHSGKYVGKKLDGLTTLGPNGTLGRAIWIERSFDEKQKLETAPSTIDVRVRTSEGRELTRGIPLREVEWISQTKEVGIGKKDDDEYRAYYVYYGRASELPPRIRALREESWPEEQIPF